MKKYRVNLLTSAGPVHIIIQEGDDLPTIEKELTEKYGTFITISTQELT